jgi:hypothetical protein
MHNNIRVAYNVPKHKKVKLLSLNSLLWFLSKVVTIWSKYLHNVYSKIGNYNRNDHQNGFSPDIL